VREFFGKGLAWEHYDELAFGAISPGQLKFEVPLFGAKWYDYRQMHPTEATYLFAACLVDAYRAAYKRNIDATRAEHVKVLKDRDLFKNKPALISAIWRCRQSADAMGIPYELYLALAYEYATKFWHMQHLPRPSQLYNGRIVDPMAAHWEQRQEQIFYEPESPHYLNDNYVGSAAQDQHHERLLGMISKRGDKAALIGKFVYAKQMLPEAKAELRFGSEMIASARAHFPNGSFVSAL